MMLRSRLVPSLLVLALGAAAVGGCGEAPRQEGLTRAARSIVVVQRPAPQPVVEALAATATTTGPRTEPQPGPAGAPKIRASGSGKALSVKRLVLATGVEKARREPLGVGKSFNHGAYERLYAFVEIENPGDEAEVTVSFEPPTTKPARGNVRLDVGTSPRWRTWASSRAVDEKGEWAAVVTAPDGRELAREKFVIL